MNEPPGSVTLLTRLELRFSGPQSTKDTGEPWELKSPVGEFNWEFQGCPHVDGGIAVIQQSGVKQLHALVWSGLEERHGLYWVRSTDGGDSWSEPQRMGGELARNADLGASGRTLVAAWDETRGI